MREWRVTHIVKEGCRAHRKSIFCCDRITLAQAIKNARHQVQRPKAMREPRMFGPLICVESKTELLDASQPLKLRCVDQTDHQLTLRRVGTQRYDVVNRIAIDSLGQRFG